MNNDFNAAIYAILTALGGYLIRYIWDLSVKHMEHQSQKIQSYDEDAMLDKINEAITKANEPLKAELALLNNKLTVFQKDFINNKEQNLLFYKYQLINACKKYLAQGYLSQYQFDSLSELHKIYHNLHGNGQGDEYYNRAIALPIKTELHPEEDIEDEVYVERQDLQKKQDNDY